MSTETVRNSKRGLGTGAGRAKGTPNKLTASLKEMILNALESAGGEEYLARQAVENPVAFLGLVGKLLPSEIKNLNDSEMVITIVGGNFDRMRRNLDGAETPKTLP